MEQSAEPTAPPTPSREPADDGAGRSGDGAGDAARATSGTAAATTPAAVEATAAAAAQPQPFDESQLDSLTQFKARPSAVDAASRAGVPESSGVHAVKAGRDVCARAQDFKCIYEASKSCVWTCVGRETGRQYAIKGAHDPPLPPAAPHAHRAARASAKAVTGTSPVTSRTGPSPVPARARRRCAAAERAPRTRFPPPPPQATGEAR